MQVYQTQIEVVDQLLGQSIRVTQPNYMANVRIRVTLPGLGSSTTLIAVNDVRVEVHELNKTACAQTVRTTMSTWPVEQRQELSTLVQALLERIISILQTSGLPATSLSIRFEYELLARNIVNRLPVSDEDYRKAAKDLGISFADMKAIAIAVGQQEGKSTPFLNDFPRVLYERHLMYRHIKQKETQRLVGVYSETMTKKAALKKATAEAKAVADAEMEANPELVNRHGFHARNKNEPDPENEYGAEVNQYVRLERAERIDADSARQSTSYGMYQVLGENYAQRYQSSKEMEAAMDSNLEQFLYFIAFLKTKKGAIQAIREHNWEHFASAYNGKGYKPEYPAHIQKYYNCAVDPKNSSAQAVNQCINPATKSRIHAHKTHHKNR